MRILTSRSTRVVLVFLLLSLLAAETHGLAPRDEAYFQLRWVNREQEVVRTSPDGVVADCVSRVHRRSYVPVVRFGLEKGLAGGVVGFGLCSMRPIRGGFLGAVRSPAIEKLASYVSGLRLGCRSETINLSPNGLGSSGRGREEKVPLTAVTRSSESRDGSPWSFVGKVLLVTGSKLLVAEAASFTGALVGGFCGFWLGEVVRRPIVGALCGVELGSSIGATVVFYKKDQVTGGFDFWPTFLGACAANVWSLRQSFRREDNRYMFRGFVLAPVAALVTGGVAKLIKVALNSTSARRRERKSTPRMIGLTPKMVPLWAELPPAPIASAHTVPLGPGGMRRLGRAIPVTGIRLVAPGRGRKKAGLLSGGRGKLSVAPLRPRSGGSSGEQTAPW